MIYVFFDIVLKTLQCAQENKHLNNAKVHCESVTDYKTISFCANGINVFLSPEDRHILQQALNSKMLICAIGLYLSFRYFGG